MRSLGGMTYSGLKSFLYAGVGKDGHVVKRFAPNDEPNKKVSSRSR
jgi:glutathione peroxidase-family protein